MFDRSLRTPGSCSWPCPAIPAATASWYRVAVLAFSSVVAVVGCGGGGGGGGSAPSAPPQVQITAVSVSPALSGSSVVFTLLSPAGHPASVLVEFSENRGISFSKATLSSGATTALTPEDGGSSFAVIWEPTADLSTTNQADLQIRVTPTDETSGQSGVLADSATFALGSSSAPVINSVTTPTGTQGGEITFSYTVSDAESDVISLALHYSTNSGFSWNDASVTTGGNGTTAVTTDTSPVSRTAVWNAQADLSGTTSSTIQLRITPSDVSQGLPGATANFAVNLIAPTLSLLTVGEIPDTMNGNTSYVDGSGTTQNPRLTVPANGFRLRVEYSAGAGGGALDLTSLLVSCNQAMGSSAAGTNLATQFDPGSTTGAWDVSASQGLGGGTAVWTATIQDTYGNRSDPATITADVTSAGSSSRPFDVSDTWWVDFDFDQFTTSFTGGTTVSISSSSGANGIPDFQEDLLILGLRTNSPTSACATLGSNSILVTLATTEVLGRLNELFGKNFAGSDAGFSSGISFQSAVSGSHSSIRIGGDDANSGYTLGRAQFDYRNAVGNNNRSTTLGVFTTNMLQFYINSSFSFKNRFDPLISGRGTPAGEGSLDHIVLDPTFDRTDVGNSFQENARYDDIYDAIDALARSSAVVLAHEIGHSIGLCANNPPPLGLFGGESDAPFSSYYSTAYHFDSSGNNLMAAALSFSTSLISTSTGYQFNELNEAYLREWIILE